MYIAQKGGRKKKKQQKPFPKQPKTKPHCKNYQVWFKYFCSSGREKNRFNSEPTVINIHYASFPIWKCIN